MTLDRDAVLKALSKGDPRGLRADELAAALNADAKGGHRVRRLLAELVEDGAVEKAPGSRYRLRGRALPADGAEAAPGLVAGLLRVHPAGYGFVARDDGEEDVFVPARFRGHALDGDRVALTTWPGWKGTEGRVEKVLKRGRSKVTGILQRSGRTGPLHLEPDDPRVLATHGRVHLEGPPLGREGQVVVVEIVTFPSEEGAPLGGRVVRVLGEPGDLNTEIEKALVCGDVPTEFPDEVLAAAARAPTEVRPADLVDRVDLRDRPFLTIDPETARDFDDAVFVEPGTRPGMSRLWVAVADVSHYVRPGEALDREARARGCSVYLPDRAIPMLPKELSAGICSLNPEVDRLAMVARMEVDPDGGVHDPYFCAAVIRSHGRLDYAGVAAALAGDLRGPRARYRQFLPALEALREVSRHLRKRRTARGALDFELPEAKVVLDEDDPRLVRTIVESRGDPAVRGAYQMIEDFMLAANEAVARLFRERGVDAVWRVHDVPADERLATLGTVAAAYGVKFDPDEGRDPRRFREFLARTAQLSEGARRAIHFLALRALKQAAYDIVNVGHFGLAAEDYVHFTSPIRRYPDLLVHRLLKHLLHGDGVPAGGPPAPPEPRHVLAQMATESSANERRAVSVEREVLSLYGAYLLRDRIGEVFDGTVSGVASFGLFIQLEDPFVEGMIRITELGDDFWEHDADTMRLVGRRTGRSFALGDEVRVIVENVSVGERKVDLRLVAAARSERRGLPPAQRAGKAGRRAAAEKARARSQTRERERGRDRSRDGKKGKPGKGGGKRRR